MDTRWQLVAYVFVSIILRMVAAQLSRRRRDIAWVRFLSEGWAASVLRFGYYVGLPYIALILGVMPGRYMGLVGLGQPQDSLSVSESGFLAPLRDYLALVILNWLPDLGTVVALGAVTLLFLSLTWFGYAYLRGYVESGGGIGPSSHRGDYRLGVLQVIYQAVHWGFYRGAVWLLTDDLYLGVIGGIILVGGEWMLDAGCVHKARHARAGEVFRIDASVLVATSLIFFFVPNLWLLIPVHWLLALASRRVVVPGYERAGENRSGDIVYQIRQRAS
jgi:hypothetical protein